MVAPARCRDQAELLTYFDLPIALLQTPARCAALPRSWSRTWPPTASRTAEVRWAPRLHLERGLSVRDVLEAVAEGTAAGLRAGGAGTTWSS